MKPLEVRMICENTHTLNNKEYFKQFLQHVHQERIPLNGTIDLTHRCNLKCCQCYLGDAMGCENGPNGELSTETWLAILKEISEAGCLYLLISGGESLLRTDFPIIYRAAKDLGMLVSVYTNGTTITESLVQLFKSYTPHQVEITLYGATAETYEKVTRVKGSFAKCQRGIAMLHEHDIPFRLKTILLNLNVHEFGDMEAFSQSLGVKFRLDAAVFPTLGGDKSPISYRVPAEKAVSLELSNPERLDEWRTFYQSQKEVSPGDKLYQCGAGVSAFYIDPYGNLRPCLMVTDLSENVIQTGFTAAWRDVMVQLGDRKPAKDNQCHHCRDRIFCGYCPAYNRVENFDEETPSEFLCQIGRLRSKKIRV